MKHFLPLKHSDAPFSSAVRVGDIVSVSGQIGRDDSGALVPGGVGPETSAALVELERNLERVGAGLRDVIKTLVFLVDIADYAEYNRIYRQYFPKDFPCRSTVVVKELVQGACIEIEALAVVSGNP